MSQIVDNALSKARDELREYISRDIHSLSTKYGFQLSIETPETISDDDLGKCFGLLKENMEEMYKASSWGWNESQKRSELKEPATRYLLIHDDSNLVAFLSFQIEVEFEVPIFYLYEIQVSESHRGKGLGQSLLTVFKGLAQTLQIQKLMMTVFTSNTRAIDLYTRLGFTTDPSSPSTRRLRTSLHSPDYKILSTLV